MPDQFTFYNNQEYIHGQSLINNIFFGRPKIWYATRPRQDKPSYSPVAN